MKSPLLLCSVAPILLLTACGTAPTAPAERTFVLRHGKVLVTPAAACCMPPVEVNPVMPPPPPVPVPVVVSTPPVSLPPPPPTPEPLPPVAVPVAVVVTPPAPPPPPAAPAIPPGTMKAVRTGTTAHLSWTLPESTDGYRAIEIMRNEYENPQGRGRIRAVRGTLTEIDDTLPDAAANYWYWIKLTATDGTITNLGPFAATPAP